ncbi:MAG: iron-containing alcohol dehydrogenase [Promethearchaeota archaeon]
MLARVGRWAFRRLIGRKVEFTGVRCGVPHLGNACVVTSPSAWEAFKGRYPATTSADPGRLVVDPSIQVGDVRTLAGQTLEGTVVGVGGGMVLDVAKAVAKFGKKKAVLVPTVLSTTAWLNPAASLKDGTKVSHRPGKFDRVVLDLDLISAAPRHLNAGGLADILCAYNALGDWILAKDIGKARIPRRAEEKVLSFCERVVGGADRLSGAGRGFVELVASSFLEAMELCYSLLSGRPLEGGEHFLYYAMEEALGRPLNHGSVIALNTLSCLYLRGGDALVEPGELRALYDKLGVSYSLEHLGISTNVFRELVMGMPGFVSREKLPYSLWNEPGLLDGDAVDSLVGWLQRPPRIA